MALRLKLTESQLWELRSTERPKLDAQGQPVLNHKRAVALENNPETGGLAVAPFACGRGVTTWPTKAAKAGAERSGRSAGGWPPSHFELSSRAVPRGA